MATTIDWPAILTDIAYQLGDVDESHPDSRVPCSSRVLARDLEVERDQVRRWHEGSIMEYSQGVKLLRRWSDLTGKAQEFAPRKHESLSAAKLRERV